MEHLQVERITDTEEKTGLNVTYILCFSVDDALQYPSEVCSWMLLAVPCARASKARRVISPGSIDDGWMLLMRARTRPAKAETTHLRDAATAFLKGTENGCLKRGRFIIESGTQRMRVSSDLDFKVFCTVTLKIMNTYLFL